MEEGKDGEFGEEEGLEMGEMFEEFREELRLIFGL
jgi:hypothetical protein